ncbi:PREDICTED: putative phospholipase B-like 2 isoform X2 [Priapulus caudatus]|nr:PREDICTED: putative phospholipase B-like 2 isoform X2 [Priapulus caudatus]
MCTKLQKFIEINNDWLENQIAQRADTDPYWHQIQLIIAQLNGLNDGFSRQLGDGYYQHTLLDNDIEHNTIFHDIPFANRMLMFQLSGDLEDLEQVFNKNNVTLNRFERVLGSGSCSALIKLLPGNKDLYFAHDSWSTYQSMLRILKKYNFQYHSLPQKGSDIVPGHTMSMSSYPGTIFSIDDFYLLSSSLVAMETTIGNSNAGLWPQVKPQRQVLEWMRVLVATRLANTGKEWTAIFSKFNSGTYNNQWMIVDFNLFTPGRPLPEKGLLYVLEQLPGMIVSKDMTSILAKQTYWPSYNSPYFPQIFKASGLPEMVEKYGDWFTYDRTPRALIFKRDHTKVVDTSSMIKLMRYNDFKNDPLSRCNCTPPYSAENAIAARSDLNPANGTYPFASLGHRSHGAIDMKLTNFDMAKRFEFIAIAGPTHDPLPPFQWSTASFPGETPHVGHPDLWSFDPIHVTWTQLD